MAGNSIDDDSNLPSLRTRNVLLVGPQGNGKSATGNSIIGRKSFKSIASTVGVASTTEMRSATFNDGQFINVIDTIGLCDSMLDSEVVGEELAKSFEMAKNGIHAIVLVLSVKTGFTVEEAKSLDFLRSFFGPRINDYMIVVFTGGDELESNDKTFDEYLGHGCPEPLQNILNTCKNRSVLFNNRTKDVVTKANQTQQLLNYVEIIMEENGGRPYTDSIFKELTKEVMQFREQEKRLESLEKRLESLEGYSAQEISNGKEKEAMKLRDQEKCLESLEGYSAQGRSNWKEPTQKSTEDLQKWIDEMLKMRETVKEQFEVEHAAPLKAERMVRFRQDASNAEELLKKELQAAPLSEHCFTM